MKKGQTLLITGILDRLDDIGERVSTLVAQVERYENESE